MSFFTDMASEMVYPLLPLFLTRVLGAGAMSLGVIEGVAEAANSVLKISPAGSRTAPGRRRTRARRLRRPSRSGRSSGS